MGAGITGFPVGIAVAAVAAIVLAVAVIVVAIRVRGALRIACAILAALLLLISLDMLYIGHALLPSPGSTVVNHPAPVPDALSIYYYGFFNASGAKSQYPGTHALRARDASLRWQRSPALGSDTYTISDGVMYLASASFGSSPSTTLFALRASDGAQLWSVPIVNPALPEGVATAVVLGVPVVAGNTVLLNVDNGAAAYETGLIIALRKDNGQELWRQVFVDDAGGLSAGSGFFYLGSSAAENSVRAFHVSDGSLAWQTNVESHGTRPFYASGVVYVSPAGVGQITALRASDGKVLWTYGDAARELQATVLDVSGGAVYLGGTDGTTPPSGTGFNNYVYALDATTGALRWRFALPVAGGMGDVGGVTAADGVVYIGATGGLYALDADTGAVQWRRSTGEFVIFYGPQVADGVIFAASDDVRLHTSPGFCTSCEADYFNALSARDGSFYWRMPASWAGSPPPLVVG